MCIMYDDSMNYAEYILLHIMSYNWCELMCIRTTLFFEGKW